MHSSLNRRILIIDDNPSIHNDFRKVLAAESYWGGNWPGNLAADHVVEQGGRDQDRDASSLEQKEALLFGETENSPANPCFEIDSAYQGEEGCECISKARCQGRPYAMAFVDVRMPPGWDGIETIERIISVDPEIHFVICSAYSDYAAGDIISRLGLTERLLILRKPCDTAEILLMADTLCQKWNLTRAIYSLQRRS